MSAAHDVIRADVREVLTRAAEDLPFLDGKRVLVTGGAGFLLSYLVDVLAARGEEVGSAAAPRVVAIDNFTTGRRNRLAHLATNPAVELRELDICRWQPGEKFDVIVHGASIASPIAYRRMPLRTLEANALGTWMLLLAAEQDPPEQFVLLSTSEVYGDPDPDHVPTPETYAGRVSFTGPRACYDESKRFAETLALAYFREHGTPIRIVRPFNVYGPGLPPDDGRAVPSLVEDARNGRDLVLHSDGSPRRSFCYVTDFIVSFLRVLARGKNGEAYNVGDDREEISMRELAERIRTVTGTGGKVTLRESPDPEYLIDNPQRRCPDLTKLRALGGFAPAVGLEEGLGRYLCWLTSDADGAASENP